MPRHLSGSGNGIELPDFFRDLLNSSTQYSYLLYYGYILLSYGGIIFFTINLPLLVFFTSFTIIYFFTIMDLYGACSPNIFFNAVKF